MDGLKSAGYKVPVYWHAKDISKNWDPVSEKVDTLLNLYGSVDINIHKDHGSAPVSCKYGFLRKPLSLIRRIFYFGLNSAVVLPVNAPVWRASRNANYSLRKSLLVRAFHLPKELKHEIRSRLHLRKVGR